MNKIMPLLLLFMFAACTVTVKSNKIDLPYENSVTIEQAYQWPKLITMTDSGDIDLTGVDNMECSLTVDYFEHTPGDATVYVEDGKLMIKSKSGKGGMISNVAGTVPSSVNLDLVTGSGEVNLYRFSKNNYVKVTTGAGTIKLNDFTKVNSIVARTGAGEIELSDMNQIDNANAATGSGNIYANELTGVDNMKLGSGSGCVYLERVNAKTVNAKTGVGNIEAKNCDIAHKNFGSGLGSSKEIGENSNNPL